MAFIFSKDTRSKKRGFTLVEIIVSVGIFSVVVTVAIGSLLSVINANRKAQALQSVMSNLNFTLDQMSRDIRVGSDYHCIDASHASVFYADILAANDCPSISGEGFAFKSHTGSHIIYRKNGTSIERSVEVGTSGTMNGFVAVTAPEINVKNVRFYVVGATLGDPTPLQPRVLVSISGEAGTTTAKSLFNIQTTISARRIDR